MNNNELISIIVPIYNVEKYLVKCIDSIISQNYTNIEIILVNDGSSDDSGIICDEYARKDNRIRVIHKINSGISDARNVAIDKALGEYYTFIDSDDYVDVEYISTLYKNLLDNHSDISIGGYDTFYGKTDKKQSFDNIVKVYDNRGALENMLYQKNIYTSAWGKLYNKRLFANIRYPSGKNCEDLGTTYKLIYAANKISTITNPIYHYYYRLNGLSKAQFNITRMDGLVFAREILNSVESLGHGTRKAAINRLFMEAIYILVTIYKNRANYINEYSECKNLIREYRQIVLFDSNSRVIYRIYALVSYIGISGLCKAYSFKASTQEHLKI